MPKSTDSLKDLLKAGTGPASVDVAPEPTPETTHLTPVVESKVEEIVKASPTAAANAFRDNPEAFFGPVIGALLASGVNEAGVKPKAIKAYWVCLELCDWVANGGAADQWKIESEFRRVEKEWAAKDLACQETKTQHDRYNARLISTDPEAAERPGLELKVKDLKAQYKRLEIEALDLLKRKTDLQARRMAS